MIKKEKKTDTSTKIKGAYGSPKYPYSITPSSLRKCLQLIPEKPKPSKVTTDTLKTWGLKNSNDYTILRVLKALDFLSTSGEPTSKYSDFMTKGIGPSTLGQQMKSVYSALFETVSTPESASDEDLKNFFNINSGGAEDAIRHQINTFKVLREYATFGDSDPIGSTPPGMDEENLSGTQIARSSGPTLRIDLHIHLPENKTKADYESILESIAKNIYGKNI